MDQDGTKDGFFMVSNALFDSGYPKVIGPIGVAVYCYLQRRADRRGECFPKARTIAADIGSSRATVFRALSDLEAVGLIGSRPERRTGRVNRFKVYQPRRGFQPSVKA